MRGPNCIKEILTDLCMCLFRAKEVMNVLPQKNPLEVFEGMTATRTLDGDGVSSGKLITMPVGSFIGVMCFLCHAFTLRVNVLAQEKL